MLICAAIALRMNALLLGSWFKKSASSSSTLNATTAVFGAFCAISCPFKTNRPSDRGLGHSRYNDLNAEHLRSQAGMRNECGRNDKEGRTKNALVRLRGAVFPSPFLAPSGALGFGY